MSEVSAKENEGGKVPGENASPAELKARQGGWVSEKEWKGAPEEWVSAYQFNERGEMMARISAQSDAIKSRDVKMDEMQTALKGLSEHNKKIAEMEKAKAIKFLRKEKAAAAREEDDGRVAELEEEIDELKALDFEEESVSEASAGSAVEQAKEGKIPKEFQEWMDKPENSWYNTDVVLRGAVDAVAMDYARSNPGVSPKQIIDHLEEQRTTNANLIRLFPETPGKSRAPVSSPGSRGAGGKSKFTESDLNETQLQMARAFVAQGVMEMQEYVDQLADLGELD